MDSTLSMFFQQAIRPVTSSRHDNLCKQHIDHNCYRAIVKRAIAIAAVVVLSATATATASWAVVRGNDETKTDDTSGSFPALIDSRINTATSYDELGFRLGPPADATRRSWTARRHLRPLGRRRGRRSNPDQPRLS